LLSYVSTATSRDPYWRPLASRPIIDLDFSGVAMRLRNSQPDSINRTVF
jgi:hypothetical protein